MKVAQVARRPGAAYRSGQKGTCRGRSRPCSPLGKQRDGAAAPEEEKWEGRDCFAVAWVPAFPLLASRKRRRMTERRFTLPPR